MNKNKKSKVAKNKLFTIVNDHDGNESYSIVAKDASDAAHKALEELGWFVSDGEEIDVDKDGNCVGRNVGMEKCVMINKQGDLMKKNKKYDVTITATVTKTIRVIAKNEDEAVEEANGIFSVLNDDYNERYNQEIDGVKEVIEEVK